MSTRQFTQARQIVGFSLSKGMAIDVKTEAARRDITLVELFEETWAVYKKSGQT